MNEVALYLLCWRFEHANASKCRKPGNLNVVCPNCMNLTNNSELQSLTYHAQGRSWSILWMFQKDWFGKSYSSWGGMIFQKNIYDFLPLPMQCLCGGLGGWWVTQYVSRVYQAISSLSATLRRMRRLHWFWEKSMGGLMLNCTIIYCYEILENVMLKAFPILVTKASMLKKKKNLLWIKIANVWQL